ncbi:hypothetical protein [Streptacidiphilus albus]|uniref:hypothetical protein n=1 Tax=Streptacidiphilus albus TaxID=105425 RepID=UPI0005A95835|nr:hypothetical protein [Streptacidiphilus albus]
MRRIKAAMSGAAVLVTAIAGIGVAVAPAQASSTYCQLQGGTYLCADGVTTTTLGNGTKEEFIVGTDNAVWTNWDDTNGNWNGWVSMGGVVESHISIYTFGDNDPDHFAIVATGTDNNIAWDRQRSDSGSWTPWASACFMIPDLNGCA